MFCSAETAAASAAWSSSVMASGPSKTLPPSSELLFEPWGVVVEKLPEL